MTLTAGAGTGVDDMSGSRRRTGRVGAFVLALILLIPLSLSGHHHRADDATAKQECAVCMVTSACPVVQSAATPTLVAPAASGIAVASAPTLACNGTHQPFKAGRAPPTALASRPA